MTMKKYIVTKDIYHKGKLMKTGDIVASETGHKYFDLYKKDEFSNEKEGDTLILKAEADADSKYDENGVVRPSEESKKAARKKAATSKVTLKADDSDEKVQKILDEANEEAESTIENAKAEAAKIIEAAKKASKVKAPKAPAAKTKAAALATDEDEKNSDSDEDVKFPEDSNENENVDSDDAF